MSSFDPARMPDERSPRMGADAGGLTSKWSRRAKPVWSFRLRAAHLARWADLESTKLAERIWVRWSGCDETEGVH